MDKAQNVAKPDSGRDYQPEVGMESRGMAGGHRFCRYADDCNIYVKSKKSGDRVMASIGKFIEEQLKLNVNRTKSAVDSPAKRKFLGFSFYFAEGGAKMCTHRKSLDRVKAKVKTYTKRSNGWSVEERVSSLSSLTGGWVSYFKIADMRKHCQRLDEWMHRRLRMCIWKQWKKVRCRHDSLGEINYLIPFLMIKIKNFD